MKTLIALAALLLTACSPVPPQLATGPEVDAAWTDVTACYAVAGYSVGQTGQPSIIVRDDCQQIRDHLEFVGADGALHPGQAWTHRGLIEVCPDYPPDLLRHEMSHVASYAAGLGDGENSSGVCWL